MSIFFPKTCPYAGKLMLDSRGMGIQSTDCQGVNRIWVLPGWFSPCGKGRPGSECRAKPTAGNYTLHNVAGAVQYLVEPGSSRTRGPDREVVSMFFHDRRFLSPNSSDEGPAQVP